MAELKGHFIHTCGTLHGWQAKYYTKQARPNPKPNTIQ